MASQRQKQMNELYASIKERLRDRPWPVFGTGRPGNWVAADVARVADGMLAEHWDVLQDEATKAELRSGLPMFGTRFPSARSQSLSS
jgi:hypothetical protein